MRLLAGFAKGMVVSSCLEPRFVLEHHPKRMVSFPHTCLVAAWILLISLRGFAAPADQELRSEVRPDLPIPHVRLNLEGPMANRIEGIIRHWLIPAPEANPGMLEMMRLRERKPPYEDPVPWAGEFAGKYLTSCVLQGRRILIAAEKVCQFGAGTFCISV